MTMNVTFGELSRALKNGAKPVAALNENGRQTARGSGYLPYRRAMTAFMPASAPLYVTAEAHAASKAMNELGHMAYLAA